jgi:hypothetical protein
MVIGFLKKAVAGLKAAGFHGAEAYLHSPDTSSVEDRTDVGPPESI